MMCINCGVEIPSARLEVIPETKTCVNCSEVQPYKAIVNGSAKNKNFEVQIIPGDSPIVDYLEEQGQRGFSSLSDDE